MFTFSSMTAAALAGIVLSAAAHQAIATDHPAYISAKEVQGEVFKRPTTQKVPDGKGTALDITTFASKDKKFSTGMFQAGPEHVEYTSGHQENEFIYVVKGSITLTSPDGTVIVVGPGEAATIAKGWKGRWDTDGYTKLWVLYDPDAK